MLRAAVRPEGAAVGVLREAAELAAELGTAGGSPPSLFNRALLLRGRGDRRGAIALLDRDEPICRERATSARSPVAASAGQLIAPVNPTRRSPCCGKRRTSRARLGLPGPHLQAVYEQGPDRA